MAHLAHAKEAGHVSGTMGAGGLSSAEAEA